MSSILDCKSHNWRIGCEVCLAQSNKDYQCKKCDRSIRVCVACKKVCVKQKLDKTNKSNEVQVQIDERNRAGKVVLHATTKPKAKRVEKSSYKIEQAEESSDKKSQIVDWHTKDILWFLDLDFHVRDKSALKKVHDVWTKILLKKLSASAFHALVLLIQITFLDVMDLALCLQLTYQTGPSSQFKKTKGLEECFPFQQTKMHHYPKWTLFFQKFINQSIEEAKKKFPPLVQKTDCFGVREYNLMRVEMSMAHQQQEIAANLCDRWIVRYLLPPRLQFDEQKRVKRFAYLLTQIFQGTRCLPPFEIDNFISSSFVDTKDILTNYPAHAEKFISELLKEELHQLYLELPEIKRKLVQQPQKIAKLPVEELVTLFPDQVQAKLPRATNNKIVSSYKKELVQLLQKELVIQKRNFANQIFNEILQKKVQDKPLTNSQTFAFLITQSTQDTLATVDPTDPSNLFSEKKNKNKNKNKKFSQKDHENLLHKSLWNLKIEPQLLVGILPAEFSKNQIHAYNKSSDSKFLEAEQYFAKKKMEKATKAPRTVNSNSSSSREKIRSDSLSGLSILGKLTNLSVSNKKSEVKDKKTKDKTSDEPEGEKEEEEEEEGEGNSVDKEEEEDEEDQEQESDTQNEELDEEEIEMEDETSDHEERR